MIEKLDIPRKQVYVEALILETSLTRTDSFGLDWFTVGANNDLVGYGSTGVNPTALTPGTIPMPGGFGAGIMGNMITYNGLTFPSIGAFLNALRTDSGINIVSNPQILTIDNQDAETFSGENIPFKTGDRLDVNNNLSTTYDYRNVGIRLKVTPQISGETINLDVDLAVDQVSPSEDGYSSTLTRTTKTKVQLEDNTIMVISGLMKDGSTTYTSGIPFLSRIPILGWLFKNQTNSSDKTNLMVFISARIINTREDAVNLLERRTRGSYMFNEQVNKMISDNLTNSSPSFIPIQKEVYDIMHGPQKENEPE